MVVAKIGIAAFGNGRHGKAHIFKDDMDEAAA